MRLAAWEDDILQDYPMLSLNDLQEAKAYAKDKLALLKQDEAAFQAYMKQNYRRRATNEELTNLRSKSGPRRLAQCFLACRGAFLTAYQERPRAD